MSQQLRRLQNTFSTFVELRVFISKSVEFQRAYQL